MLASDSKQALTEFLAHAEAGGRVYVLVSPGWDSKSIEDHHLSDYKVLFRRVPEVPATGVYRANEARLRIDNPANASPWSLKLDRPQSEAFRQIFLRLFWHKATEEAWMNERQLTFRVAGERPFDVPELPNSAPLRLLPPETKLAAVTSAALMHLMTGIPPQSAPRRLWFPASGEHHDSLSQLVRQGTQIVWGALGLPDLVINENKGMALLSGERERLRIELNEGQAADLARILEGPAEWKFHLDARLGDHSQGDVQLWLPGKVEAQPVEIEQRIEVSQVQTDTLRTFVEAQPESWPSAQPLALSARYTWTVIPPRLPASSEEDPLVVRWRKIDEEWIQRLSRVRRVLHSTEGDRSRIGKAFSRLMSAMLGFERTQSDLLASVESLERRLPSAAGPAEAERLLKKLVEVEEETNRLEGALKEAEKKAREDEAREKQESDWRSRVETAKYELGLRRKDFAEAERHQYKLMAELGFLEERLQSETKELGKDLEVQKKKVTDELMRLNGKISRLRDAIKVQEQRSVESFKFIPSAPPPSRPGQSGGRFVPTASTARPVVFPEEALPAAGVLRKQGGQRFLVIEKWEDLGIGEQEAGRLKAKLVAPENV
ncbi:MAG: hypothetical protein AB7F21_06995 [Desulfuromonadales bacterium]